VIFHADDIGMCQATVSAYHDLVDFGLISSAATMVPCAWFGETAVYCHTHQAAQPHLDMGVHLTLTSEWTRYRWRPLSTVDPASGLFDEEGFFHRTSAAVAEKGVATAVQAEIEAQLARALAAGIDVTHLDSHMGANFAPQFVAGYVQLALHHGLPALMLRWDEAMLRKWGFGGETAVYLTQQQQLEAIGFPLFDHITMMPLDDPNERVAQAKQRIDDLPAGLSYFILHPAQDTPELRAIAPDWRCRVADYEAFTNDKLRQIVASSGVHVVGYRTLRELMRG
jgi:predicted glycoside hydrolase/deacetylase ChbG (UPF0249 family)